MDTFPRLLIHQADIHKDLPAVRVKRLGVWQTYTWEDMFAYVKDLANGLADVGVQRGDRVIVMSGNTPEALFVISALQINGAVPIPLNVNFSIQLLSRVVDMLGVKYAYGHDQQQVDALLEASQPGVLKHIFYTHPRGLDAYDQKVICDITTVRERGQAYGVSNPQSFTSAVNAIKSSDTAFIFLSSGVSQEPKGVPLSYGNLLHVARYIAKVENINEHDELLSFMPLAMPASFLYGQAISFLCGFCVSCPESGDTVLENMREIGPTLFFAPAHVYKYLAALFHNRMSQGHGLSRKLYDKYLENSSLDESSLIGELLVLSPIKNVYGLSQLRVAITGGDAVSENSFNLFRKLGVDIKQIYGCAETSGCITMQTAEEKEAKTVGHAIEGSEVKISSDGEVICRGPNVFSGYVGDGAASTLDAEGWFHTGDIGVITDNQLSIQDKMEFLTILDNGQKVMPKIVENAVKSSPYIKNSFAWVANNSIVCALIVVEEATMDNWAEQNDVRYTGYADLVSKDEVQQLITSELRETNTNIQQAAAVKRFVLLARDFSTEAGEVTWTNKLRRPIINKHFAALVERIGSDQAMVEHDDSVATTQFQYKVCKVN